MTAIQEITNEINDFTDIIKSTFPELYESLNETPLFLSYDKSKDRIIDYTRYLGFLKSQFCELVKIYDMQKRANDVTQIKNRVTHLRMKKATFVK